jgi:predicted transcriptional regulator
MSRSPEDVAPAELAILEVLWDRGPCSRRQIADVVYPGGQPAHYATVQKLIERLEAKGHVACQAEAPVRRFAATVSRDELISRRLLDVADTLCDGALTPLLLNLVRAKPLSDSELQELRDLIKELSKQLRRNNAAR